MTAPLPISPVVYFSIAIITAVITIMLIRGYLIQGKQNVFIRSFAEAYGMFSLGYMVFASAILFAPRSISLLHFAFVIGHFCILCGIARIISLIFGISYSKHATMQYNTYLICIMLNLLIILIPLRYTSYPWMNLHTGITEWIVHPYVTVTLFTSIALYLLIIFFFFFFAAIRKHNSTFARIRSGLIAGSTLLLLLGANMHYAATTPWQALTASIWIAVGFLLGFIGIMYKRSLAIWK